MMRTSRARIFPFTLTNGPEEEERGEKGRLKTPSSVETYSCSIIVCIPALRPLQLTKVK
jgi:hypothetical protein